MLRIRMRRMGKKRQHYFRMVVADQRAKRDGGFLETLGSYNPHADPPSITLNEESARNWLSKGAQPSEAAEKILRRVGVIEGAGTTTRPQAEPKPKEEPKAEAAPAAEAPAEEAPAEEAPAEAPAAEASAEEATAEVEAVADAPAAEAPAEPEATADEADTEKTEE